MTKKIKILYYGSCWPTNIGNAFVNLGTVNAIKRALGETADIYHFGGLSSFLFRKHNYPENNLNIADFTDFEYVIIGGMTQCTANFEAAEYILKKFVKNGTKIIISGGGAEKYDDDEVEAVRSWMKKLPIYAFASRDTYSYEKYADLAGYSFDGIDSAFFISDDFKPLPLNLEFNVVNFDILDEPTLINVCGKDNITEIRNRKIGDVLSNARTKLKKVLKGKVTAYPTTLDMEGRKVFRTHHAPWPTETPEKQFVRKNTTISDLPSDYLMLYAQAKTVYSDRIHACIATLAFGNKAMLFGENVPRLRMFERVGVGDIIKKPVKMDMKHLEILKEKQVQFFRDVIT
ncbi:polysaccharide pyruvyl transferase family protein [Phosphitispora sp. TUW77]|uniref:polysaccharide pyruvyl transferase family protein n=1 Tax=Phosphitispora sp. TUW77 TaxID=3152361 RepID=UPI003AB7CA63